VLGGVPETGSRAQATRCGCPTPRGPTGWTARCRATAASTPSAWPSRVSTCRRAPQGRARAHASPPCGRRQCCPAAAAYDAPGLAGPGVHLHARRATLRRRALRARLRARSVPAVAPRSREAALQGARAAWELWNGGALSGDKGAAALPRGLRRRRDSIQGLLTRPSLMVSVSRGRSTLTRMTRTRCAYLGTTTCIWTTKCRTVACGCG
jgi:hypothetical protein